MPDLEGQTCTVEQPPKYLIWSGAARVSAGQTIRRAARLLFFAVAARKLGPATFGLYAFLLALFETLALISGEGFTEYLTREVSKVPSSAGVLYFRVGLLRWIYIVVLFAPAMVFLQLLGHPKPVLWAAFWLFLTLFPRSIVAIGQGVIAAACRFTFLLWIEVVQSAGLLSVGIYLLIKAPTLQSVIWAEVASISGAALVAALQVRPLLRGNWEATLSWRRILKETATFNLYPLIINIYDRIDVVLLSILAGNFAAGIYAVPYRALGALQVLPFGLKTSILPSISGNPAAGKSEKNLCSRMLSVMYILALFPVLAVTILAGPLILLFFGKSYSASIPVLRILIWAVVPMFLNYGLNIFLLARGKERVFVWTSIVCTLVNVGANVALIPRYSYFAAAGVTILTESVLLAQNFWVIHRMFGFLPLPEKCWNLSAIFLLLMAGGLLGNVYAPSLVSAIVTFGIFATYLYATGFLHSILEWTRHGAFTGLPNDAH
jgi:O-antigen/teichoic acid export membrane protein